MTTKKVRRRDLPEIVPLVVQVGDDFRSEVFGHENPDGSAVDLSGFTIESECREEQKETSDLLLTFTLVRDDTSGEYYLTAAKADIADLVDATTDELIASEGYYDIQLTDLSGKITTYYGGPVYFKRTATA